MNLREFMRLNLGEGQRRTLHAQSPSLMAGIDNRTVADKDFALRVIQRDEEALWLLWFCLQSSFFVRIIRMRSRHECGKPCTLVDFKELPCQWSARVLGDFFAHITKPGAGVLEAFCGDDDAHANGLMEWLAVRFHEDFHPRALREHGFVTLEQSALPASLRRLFDRDERYRSIFVNRWIWGVTGVEELAGAVRPVLPPETLVAWVEEVDDAILGAGDGFIGQLEAQQRDRQRSGIPPRNTLPPAQERERPA